MPSYNFDQMPSNRRATESEKWLKYDADVLPMWVADMDFISPAPVIEALHKRVEHGVFGYPESTTDPNDLKEFRQLMVERMATLYQWNIKPADIIFLPGVVVGFNLACQAFGKPGERVMIQPPVYPPFLFAHHNAGMIRQDAPLQRQPDGSYIIDWDAFHSACAQDTRMFILCNPHNPVGRVFHHGELKRMAEICLEHHVTICSDEIHCDLIYRGHKHIPIASLSPEIGQNTITLIAPSKTFNLPGLQCSMAIIQNEEMRNKYIHQFHGVVSWVNVMGLVAAQAAYRDGQEWLDQMRLYLEANRDYLYDYVQREMPRIKMVKPEGTYLAWLDCREAGIEGKPYDFFLKQAKVALNDGGTFGKEGDGFVRLNFGCPRSMLTEALERMKRAIQ